MKTKFTTPLFVVISIILVASLTAVGYVIYTTNDRNSKLKEAQANSAQNSQNKVKESVAKLKKLILVDENETEPAIANIIEPEKVISSNPEFYKNVIKNDTLFIYPSRAIIFRESENKIINIAPIVNNQSSEGKSSIALSSEVSKSNTQTSIASK